MKHILVDFKLLEAPKEVDGELLFWARSLSSEFAEKETLDHFLQHLPNTKLIWRHRHPANYESVVMGYALEGKIVQDAGKNFIDVLFKVKGRLPEQKLLQADILMRHKQGKPLGISGSYFLYYTDGKLVDEHLEEFSGTPYPACSQCVTQSIGSAHEMALDLNKTKPDEDVEPDANEALSKLKIEDLEKLLNQATEKSRIMEKQLEDGKKTLEEKEKAIQAEKDKVAKANEGIAEQIKGLKEQLVSMQSETIFLRENKPIMDEIFKLEKMEHMLPIYKTWKKEQLQAHLEEWKKRTAEITAESQASAGRVLSAEDSENSRKKFEDMDDDAFMKEFYPNEASRLMQAKEKVKKGQDGHNRFGKAPPATEGDE